MLAPVRKEHTKWCVVDVELLSVLFHIVIVNTTTNQVWVGGIERVITLPKILHFT